MCSFLYQYTYQRHTFQHFIFLHVSHLSILCDILSIVHFLVIFLIHRTWYRKAHLYVQATMVERTQQTAKREMIPPFVAMASCAEDDPSPTKAYFVARFENTTGQKYDGFYIPHGLLEIGHALGLRSVINILQGCLPPMRIQHLEEDFNNIIADMERARLSKHPPLNYMEATEPGTIVLALSYKHVIFGESKFPRRRMSAVQKSHLLCSLETLAKRRRATQIVLWIDQLMGQRNPRAERDWVRNGILPYFAFDVIALLDCYDDNRCWIFLEKMIASRYAERMAVGKHALIYMKTHETGTVTPLQEVAASIYSGALLDKELGNEDDRKQIFLWASQLLRQKVKPTRYHDLIAGSSWQNAVHDMHSFWALLHNHSSGIAEIAWRDISKQNGSRMWNGLSELAGVPDDRVCASRTEIKAFLSSMTDQVYKVFSASSRHFTTDKAVAIWPCCRGARPPRIILCALSSWNNSPMTRVNASCVADCDNFADVSAQEFLEAFRSIGVYRSKEIHNDDDRKFSPSNQHHDNMNHSDIAADVLSTTEVQNKSASDAVSTRRLFKWSWFSAALNARGLSIQEYIDTIQAGGVQWT